MPLTIHQRPHLVPVFLFATLVLPSCQNRTPVEYRLPADFRGWVLIEHEAAACPPLEQRNGRLIVQVNGAGRACTNNAFEKGEAADSFFYIRENVKEPLPDNVVILHHNFVRCTQPGRPERRYEQFFVGRGGEPRPPVKEPCW